VKYLKTSKFEKIVTAKIREMNQANIMVVIKTNKCAVMNCSLLFLTEVLPEVATMAAIINSIYFIEKGAHNNGRGEAIH
jgi:hypothetical protein